MGDWNRPDFDRPGVRVLKIRQNYTAAFTDLRESIFNGGECSFVRKKIFSSVKAALHFTIKQPLCHT